MMMVESSHRSRHVIVVLATICFTVIIQSQSSVAAPANFSTTSSGNNNNNSLVPSANNKVPPQRPVQLRVPRDEFNSTESIRFNIITSGDNSESGSSASKQQLSSLKNLLLRFKLQDCCPRWRNVTHNVDISDELRRKSSGKHKSPLSLRGPDLLGELTATFDNITYLSIDGQPGENEREKYYTFYDNVQYFLRLIKLAHDFQLDHATSKSSSDSSSSEHIDFNRKFQRQLKSLEFKASQDPILSSFMEELIVGSDASEANSQNANFEFYEDFLSKTQFGRYYARNISMIRESVSVFDQICSHLEHIDLLGNLTRPSRQYDLVRRMSHELYQIRNDLIEQVSIRVLSNRHDVQRLFARLNDFSESRPYIRMLGDEFDTMNQPEYRDQVRQLTHLLDYYLANNMTQASFYNSLSELPEDFILLGSSIAHYYETKEVPQYSKFDADYFNQSLNAQLNSSQIDTGNQTSANQKATDARQSNLSLLTRLFN